MGARSRSRVPSNAPPSAAAAVNTGASAREMRRRIMMKSSPISMGSGRSCRQSSVILSLLAAFGVALLITFAFTFRTGQASQVRLEAQQAKLSRHAYQRFEAAAAPERNLSHPNETLRIYGFRIVREFNHDAGAFTQGLAYAGNGTLYESTGLYGRSSVRKVDLQTGKVRQKYQMNSQEFGEGLAIWKNRLLQVVWKNKKVFVYNKETLLPQGELSHNMTDGWGLTTSNEHIIGSDGTSKLYFMDPETFKEVKNLTVTDGGKEVGWLNELEVVNNEIWANIWQGGCVARISPQNGTVIGWILLQELRDQLVRDGVKGLDVLNGIAWDSDSNKVYVTGKLWPKLYQIEILDRTLTSNATIPSIRKLCNIGGEGYQ